MCTLILPKYLNVPFVSLANSYFAFDVRSPALPSFSFRYFQAEDNQKEMSFFVRFKQLMIFLFFSSSLSPLNRNLTLLHKYSPEYDTWEDLLRESLLFFHEVDHHFGNFLPVFPNHISTAGLTGIPAKNLPENILNFVNGRIVDGKELGLILMTFGSNVNYMSRSTMKKFLNAFGLLNETVIAKFSIDKKDLELISSIPPNVMVLKWLPQNDILGHPSTKLFITHCGNNGQHEALYHGVPMLGFPLFAEQHMNCKRMTVGGFGLSLNILSFTEDELLQTILDLLQNPKYENSIQHMSEAFRDQPMTAQERIVFWIEHVIKHGGSHLRSSAMDLPLYQFLCLDSVGCLLMIIISTLFFFAQLLILLWKKVAKHYKVKSSRNQLKKRS
ncbi:hypothetical protein HELRODRAFT_112580 [Helobdella robusta]|uniref:UDP-glucuronosyltransferase n=1 Tax=Helobdella robusta TaxID=6412 RepID=T1EFK8_HELRO|nr:hypothetical protein HELRODRAFT_112580 [Helobdella robusta]ESO01586.1 hypothetical protein HELRODRAFT_112580 [Helobdella robusta]